MNNDDQHILTWDIFVRVFHWLYLLLFIFAYITSDEKGYMHRYIGYAIITLVIFRIFWGFFGTKYALFSSFVCSPVKAARYFKELVLGKPKYYIGHNPAAAWMILFFLVNSMIICASGYMAYSTKRMHLSSKSSRVFSLVKTAHASDGEKRESDRSRHNFHQESNHNENETFSNQHQSWERKEKGDAKEESDSMWDDIHETSAQFMLILIGLHIAGAAASSRAHNENLIKSMLTGKKQRISRG